MTKRPAMQSGLAWGIVGLCSFAASPQAHAFTHSLPFGASQPKTPSMKTALHVSVATSFLTKDGRKAANDNVLSAFETETPHSVGMAAVVGRPPLSSTEAAPVAPAQPGSKKNRNNRKHNFAERSEVLGEFPDTCFYTLHSSAVSHLSRDTPIGDILRAIKRAQNLHDEHDLRTICSFLVEAVADHDITNRENRWGYGYRGSLLSRVAVAALHMSLHDVARLAIDTRRVHERLGMMPHESSAIVRGLMRVGNVTDAWDVLEDELRLPMIISLSPSPYDVILSDEQKDLLKHRAQALSSIASRHLFGGEPRVAYKALAKLVEMGPSVHATIGSVPLPWDRMMVGAEECQIKTGRRSQQRLAMLMDDRRSMAPIVNPVAMVRQAEQAFTQPPPARQEGALRP